MALLHSVYTGMSETWLALNILRMTAEILRGSTDFLKHRGVVRARMKRLRVSLCMEGRGNGKKHVRFSQPSLYI
jgi:hypothetical protein